MGFLKNKSEPECQVSDDLGNLVKYYASKKHIPFDQAVNELLEKGYNYWLLEEKYKDKIQSEEIWSSTPRVLRIEAGFLYYRLRTRELIEELKNLVFILSGVVADLESCYQLLEKYKNINVNIEKLKRYREELEKYLKDYILKNDRELKEAELRYVDDWDDFIKEVEKLLNRVKVLKRT